ncbi:MAG: methyltransferase domain-containing protein [Elusimicrobiota bacterium]
MYKKINRVIKNPKKIFYWLRYHINKNHVQLITVEDKSFYKYHGKLYPDYLNNGNAVSFIKEKALTYCIGKGIDIGADRWPLPGAVSIQNEVHQNANKLDRFENDSLDYVFSSHCLEHVDDWKGALVLWISKLKVGGILFLYLPHKSNKLWRPGGPWVGMGHKWSPTYQRIIKFISSKGMEIVEYNNGRDMYWSFHVVARKKNN